VTTEVQWSELQRDPKGVAALADQGTVRVRRRTGGALLLIREQDANESARGAVAGARVLRTVARLHPDQLLEILLSERPTRPENQSRQHRLSYEYRRREIGARTLGQWQYEVTSGGRIWYCPDPERRIIWITRAGTGHPKATELTSVLQWMG
jgi:hypothetical protein